MRSSTFRKAVVTTAPAVVVFALGATPVFACPNCFAAKENTLWAYYSTAILLSLLPFVLFGGIAFYWYKKKGQTPFSGQ